MNIYSRLADLVVVLHFAYVGFVVFGLLLVLLGVLLHWKWTRNFWFRAAHLAMIGIVVIEALVGITCPLTTWENALRTRAGETSGEGAFIARIVHDLMFFEGPSWVFTTVYCAFGGLVLATWIFAPPRWPCRRAEVPSA
jgi:hypothetical protein